MFPVCLFDPIGEKRPFSSSVVSPRLGQEEMAQAHDKAQQGIAKNRALFVRCQKKAALSEKTYR